MEENVKTQLMELWKSTFHDSDEYIKLIFDSYYHPEMVEYEEKDGKIIAGLLAIPYTFGPDNYGIKGVYLCGLATSSMYRGEGIMTRLMDRISSRMDQKGYSFLFLIPANEGLIRYYEGRGFVPGFYCQKDFYSSIHTFTKKESGEINVLKCDIISNANYCMLENMLEEITAFISASQSSRRGLYLNQNKNQIEVFLKEILISGGEIYIARDYRNEIQGIGLYSTDDESDDIVEKERYVKNENVLDYLRSECKKNHIDKPMTVVLLGEISNEGKSIWKPAYSSVLPEAPSVGTVGITERVFNRNHYSEIYGMVKVLRISDILKFMANESADLKYSILTPQKKSDRVIRFTKDCRGFREEILEKSLIMSDELSNLISNEDLIKLLFRRPGGDKIIDEIFGIPALDGQISMMLD